MATFFFCGIGGIGMSAIALCLCRAGHTVYGSDRSFDRNENQTMRDLLTAAGICLFPQDGTGVSSAVNTVVVSTAVEESIPDVRAAREQRIPIRRRAEILADILHAHTGIAVGGTSGKTTITAMVGHILYETGRDPLMINGGISVNTYHDRSPSNVILGRGDVCVAEADESDGSIDLYTPAVALVSNVSLDHKPIAEIIPLFESFLNRATLAGVINADDPSIQRMHLTQPHLISFSANGQPTDFRATDIQIEPASIAFRVNGLPAHLDMIGRHNVENALAAIAVCSTVGVSVEDSIRALASFRGTGRRMQVVGTVGGITVYDDYAHNPAKIQAALRALKAYPGRIYAVFQPHGFGPTRLMKDTLIQMLLTELDERLTWIMPDIYYAGGTTVKDISSRDIVIPLQQAGKAAYYLPTRPEVVAFLKERLQDGDRVIIMGGRDNTLTQLAEAIVRAIGGEK